MTRMLRLNPAERITAAEALKHRYFAEEPRPKEHYLMPTFPTNHAAAPAGAGARRP